MGFSRQEYCTKLHFLLQEPSQPRDRTSVFCISCIDRWIIYLRSTTYEAPTLHPQYLFILYLEVCTFDHFPSIRPLPFNSCSLDIICSLLSLIVKHSYPNQRKLKEKFQGSENRLRLSNQ